LTQEKGKGTMAETKGEIFGQNFHALETRGYNLKFVNGGSKRGVHDSCMGVWQVTMAGSDSWEHILYTYCVHML